MCFIQVKQWWLGHRLQHSSFTTLQVKSLVQQHLALLDPNGVLDPVGVLSVVGVLDLTGILDPAGSWIQMMFWLWLVSSQTHLGGGSCPVETVGEDTLFGGKLC